MSLSFSITKLALREGHDVLDSAYAGAASSSNSLSFRTSEYTGTSFDPYLSVTYTQTSTTTTTITDTVTYIYDHGMRRVSKTTDDGTTLYPTLDYSVEDSTTTVYVSGPSGLVASIKDDGTTSSTSTIHTDHLGSTSVVTDESGIMIELLDYDPYGTERSSWSSSSSDGEAESAKTYIGEYSDDETGLSYLNARYYDPERGQFLSQDTVYLSLGSGVDKREQVILLDPQSQNSYAYSRGNPILLKDPNGESYQSYLNAVDSAITFAMDTVSFGGWSLSLQMIDQSTAQMTQEGVSIDGLARTVGGITVGVASTATGALVAGMTAGEATVVMGAEKAVNNISNGQGLRGAQNSVVRDAIKYGQQQHRQYNPGGEYTLNKQIPGTFLRPDAIDTQSKIIRELKPNSSQAIQRGLGQLQKYVDAADKAFGSGFKGIIDTYKK